MKDRIGLSNFKINQNNNFKTKLNYLLKCLLFLYLLSFVSHFISNLIQEFFFNRNINDLLLNQQNKDQLKDSFLFNIFYILLLGPLIEETVFRLPLDLKKRHLLISALVICFFFVGEKYKFLSLYSLQTWIKIISILTVLIIFRFIKREKIEAYKGKYQGVCFYLMALSFGLLHITNFYFILPENVKFFSFLFVLPQVFLGIFIGFVRLKNGFLWGLLMHSIFNLPTVLVYIFK
jgi:hypothetical protein